MPYAISVIVDDFQWF